MCVLSIILYNLPRRLQIKSVWVAFFKFAAYDEFDRLTEEEKEAILQHCSGALISKKMANWSWSEVKRNRDVHYVN